MVNKKELGSNPEGKEIALELVREVENSKFGALLGKPESGADDKINILLVAAGLKPAGLVSLTLNETNGMTGEDFSLSDEEVKQNFRILEKLGIFYSQQEPKIEDITWNKSARKPKTQHRSVDIFIGNTQEDLDKLVKAWKDENEFEKGIALGFPRTAVEAFIKGEKLDESEVISQCTLEQRAAMSFKNFRLSREHWQKELSQVQPSLDFMAKTSQKLTEKVINRN